MTVERVVLNGFGKTLEFIRPANMEFTCGAAADLKDLRVHSGVLRFTTGDFVGRLSR